MKIQKINEEISTIDRRLQDYLKLSKTEKEEIVKMSCPSLAMAKFLYPDQYKIFVRGAKNS